MDRVVLNEIKNVIYTEFVTGRLDMKIFILYKKYLGDVQEEFLAHAERVLLGKNDEYAEEKDVLKNFMIASEMTGRLPSVIAEYYQLKHTVSILDLDSNKTYTKEYLFEKFGDWLNYAVLISACEIAGGAL